MSRVVRVDKESALAVEEVGDLGRVLHRSACDQVKVGATHLQDLLSTILTVPSNTSLSTVVPAQGVVYRVLGSSRDVVPTQRKHFAPCLPGTTHQNSVLPSNAWGTIQAGLVLYCPATLALSLVLSIRVEMS